MTAASADHGSGPRPEGAPRHPGARRAAVLGSPVSHSRSPDLHLAAYRALGLTDWTYERIECTAEALPGLVGALDDAYIGLSVTMPGKLAALEFADEVTTRARLVGSANTLVRTGDQWRADCTDIDGMLAALAQAASGQMLQRAVVIGGGGTALPTVFALAESGCREVAVVVRDRGRAAAVFDLADELGMAHRLVDFVDGPDLKRSCAEADIVVSTVPSEAAAPLRASVAGARALVDVIYDPWPTPLAEAVADAGGQVVGGLVMLLNQAYSQVEQFTGMPAPKAAMAAVLDD